MQPSLFGVLALLAGATAVWAADAPAGRTAGTVTVFAAASLSEAFRSAGERFDALHPGGRTQFNFAGTPTLVAQIEQGAPADVLAAADEASMQRLEQAGLLAGSPSIFARNRLAIVVPAGHPKRIAVLADLGRSGLVPALCAPAVPCGRYALEAFAKAGLSPPAASQEPDAKAVLTKVMLGEADAGVVYTTDVRAAGAKVEGIPIPDDHNVVARYPIAVVKEARDRPAANAFVAFVLGDEGQRILTQFGFLGR